MRLLEDKIINNILALGLTITYEDEAGIKFYHPEADCEVWFYKPDKRDLYQGLYMEFSVDNIQHRLCEFKEREKLFNLN